MKKYLFVVVISFLIGLFVGTVNSVTAENHSISNVNATNSVQGISYDYVYVNGTRYIVFMSPTGDIEVTR